MIRLGPSASFLSLLQTVDNVSSIYLFLIAVFLAVRWKCGVVTRTWKHSTDHV